MFNKFNIECIVNVTNIIVLNIGISATSTRTYYNNYYLSNGNLGVFTDIGTTKIIL